MVSRGREEQLASRAATDTRPGALPAGDGEAALVARIAGGDRRAFETLYRLYHPRLTRFLMGLTRRPALVDEVLNDTLMVVWERPGGWNGTSRLSSWLFGIAYRKAMKALRDQDVAVADDAAHERVSLEPGADARIDEGRTRQALRDAIEELSADHRTVVELTYFHDFGYREIAEIMGCPVDTVKSRMFYARRHLGRLVTGNLSDWL